MATHLIMAVRFLTLLCSAGMEMKLAASPRKTKLERAKTFDLFVSQGDDGEYIAASSLVKYWRGQDG
jgi:hypothetical protein